MDITISINHQTQWVFLCHLQPFSMAMSLYQMSSVQKPPYYSIESWLVYGIPRSWITRSWIIRIPELIINQQA
jgi:hypothetical protein